MPDKYCFCRYADASLVHDFTRKEQTNIFPEKEFPWNIFCKIFSHPIIFSKNIVQFPNVFARVAM